jgi:hypothetical protein
VFDLSSILDNAPSMLRSSDLLFLLDGLALSSFWLFHHRQHDTRRVLSIKMNVLHGLLQLRLTGLVHAGI